MQFSLIGPICPYGTRRFPLPTKKVMTSIKKPKPKMLLLNIQNKIHMLISAIKALHKL